MVQLRCIPGTEEELDTDDQGFRLDLAVDPARLRLTLNVCWLLLPANTHPVHLANWRELESLLRQLAIIYRQAQPRRPECYVRASRRQAPVRRQRKD